MAEEEQVQQEETIRLGDLLHTLWKNKILIAVITAAVFLVGIVYTYAIAKPQYQIGRASCRERV